MTKRFFGGSRVFASLCLLLGGALISNSAQAYFNTNSPMGTNTNEVLEYDSSVPYLDLFKASLPFREAAPYLTKGRVEYDRYGWPTYISQGGMAGTRLLNKLHENAIPRGYYTVLYEGQGKLEYALDAKLVQSQPGRDVILLDPGKDKEYGVKITIKSTTRGNHLRNIRVIPQGGICASNPFQRVNGPTQCGRNDYLDFERHHEKIIFNPDYLKFMRDYKVVRFMNMSGVTRNPIRHWKDRPLVQNATWGGAEGVRGAPIEIMVELANRLHADPWFTIPHGVDDDYVRRFAQYVNKHLDRDLKIYLEYSNETWNGIFSQHAYMKQGGKRLGLTDAPHVAGWKFYAKRSVEMFKIWEQTFRGKQRLIRVLAGLTGTTDMTETMLKFEDAYKHVDAFAIAPYVFGDYKALRRAHSVQQVFQVMQDKRYHHSLPRVLEAIRKQSAMTRKYGVDLIAYEGGQHLIDDKTKKEMQHPNPLFYKANRHPQMGVIYKRLLTGWKQAGGKMFVHFSSPRKYNRFGSKGIKEYITQPDHKAPKQMAVKSFIKSNPCWWQGCRSTVVTRTNKPKALTTTELSRLNNDKAPPLPNTQDTPDPAPARAPQPTAPKVQPNRAPATNNTMISSIPQLDTNFTAPSYQPNQPQNTYRNIPQLEPVTAAPTQKYQPILVALNRPPREQYVFGTKAVANYERNGNAPLHNASTYQLRRIVSGRIDGAQDLAAIWQTSWDERNLYLRIAVRDDQFQRDSRYSWEDDSIEVFIDADASRQQRYDQFNDFHLLYRWRDKRLVLGSNSQNIGVAHQSQHVNGHYVLDMKIPWGVMRVRPRPGHRLGIDVHVNDDDDGQGREGKLTWFGKVDEAYRNPSVLGELVLR
ncbi:MAG: sugar-binding protein [Thiolinea sp.]